MKANMISIAAKLAVVATVVTLAGATPVYASSSDIKTDGKRLTYSYKLPSMTVVKQWSHVRAEPEVTGAVVDTLELGSQIRVLDIVNKWILVRYNDGKKSGTGFMHQSLLGYFNSSADGSDFSDGSDFEVTFTEIISSSISQF